MSTPDLRPAVPGCCIAPAPRLRPLLLVIDPDPRAAGLQEALGAGSVDVRVCATGAEGLLMTGSSHPDVVLLVAVLPDVPAPTVVALLSQFCGLPVIVAIDGEHADIAGAALEAGAAACVVHPYRPAQLLAMVHAVSTRSEASDEPVVRCGALELDPTALDVHLRGAPIHLPPREFRVLHYLMAHEGKVVSQSRLWEAVWGGTGPSVSNTISVHIRRLRRRLGDDPRDPRIITTVGRSGYRLQPPPA